MGPSPSLTMMKVSKATLGRLQRCFKKRFQMSQYGQHKISHSKFLPTFTRMIGSKTHPKMRPIGMQMMAATVAEMMMATGLITTAGPASSIGRPVMLSTAGVGGDS